MANFAQRRIARESVEGTGTVVPDGLELPAESVEGILADLAQDEKEINQNDAEHDVLTEDADETDAQLDAVDAADDAAEEPSDDKMEAEEDMPDEAADALDVAQESIRRRWGFDHRVSVAQEAYGSRKRRQVARESLWEDIKAFLKRAWEWLKEQGRKIKDRWLKFSNQGKSIVKRSKKYTEQIKKLGKQKSGKDKLSGGFIKDLTVDGKFLGDNPTEAMSLYTTKSDFAGNLESSLNSITHMVDMVVSVSEADFKKTEAQSKDLLKQIADEGKNELPLAGNQVLKVEFSGASEDDFALSTTLIDSDKSVADEVSTPSISALSSINAAFLKLGNEIEKRVKAYHSLNQKRDKYESSIEKLLKKLDGIKIDEQDGEFSKSIRIVRKTVSATNQFIGAAERADASNTKCLAGGFNSYLIAGIAAYELK